MQISFTVTDDKIIVIDKNNENNRMVADKDHILTSNWEGELVEHTRILKFIIAIQKVMREG